MALRPEFLDVDVNGVTLGALRWPGLLGTPAIVAIHDVTSNAWAWDPLAHHLSGGAQILAVDLRGRGRSYETPGPFGIRQHADDVAGIIEQLDVGPVVVLGHSRGAAIALMTAERHPDLVRDLVLVDGGPPIDRPAGADTDWDALLDIQLGWSIERLRTVWLDRVSYHSMWAGHPAFRGGISPDLERNLLAELIEVDGGFVVAAREEAVRVDGLEVLLDDEVRSLLDRRAEPTKILRAEFGMSGGPPAFISEAARDWFPQHRWVEAPGLNHYTIMNSSTGADLIADAVREAVTTP